MKADQWQSIEEIFHAALERNPEERASFVEANCAGNSALLKDVKALLESYEKDDSFFEDSACALAAEMFADRVGETIGRYKVLSELGSGAMGIVYLAQDIKLPRKIALKLLPTQFTNDKDRLRRFQQEADAASALNHPNILTVFEVEQTAGLHYIATEFVDGVTLRSHINNQRMSLGEVLDIATQVAGALQAAHAAGIVHRDIKPENIMIRSDGYIKVLDFGLAKLAEKESSPATETNPGVVMGTPRYMSPEQARGLDVDQRTDIFSLGTVIYEMVTGRAPFEGETTSDIIAALIKDEPESMRLTVPELPVQFELVVSKALEKDLSLRYQTIAELLADLAHLKDQIKLNALERTRSDGAELSLTESGNRQATTLPSNRSTGPQVPQKTEILPRSISIKWAIPVMVGLTVVVAIAVIVSLNRRRTGSKVDLAQGARLLTTGDGFISASRFGPDGKSIIYSAGYDGKDLELFITDAQGSRSQALGVQHAALKSVSRTGKIAILQNFELNWSDGYKGTLLILPAVGAQPEVRIDGVDDAAFAPDGNSFAIIRPEMGQQQLEYPEGNVLYKSEGWMSYPRFSPKGDQIAFFEHQIGDISGSLVTIDPVTKKKTVILTEWEALKGLAWNPNNQEIWFGGSKLGKRLSINAVSLSGQLRPNVYAVSGIGARIDDISDDGKMLINQGSNHSSMMMLTDKAPATGVDSNFAWAASADISADGSTLLFYQWGYESDNPSGETVYLHKLNEPEPIQLGTGRALALSPDGKWALVLQRKPQQRLVLLSTSPGEVRPLPNHDIKEFYYASFFPDGRRILFTGVDTREAPAIRSYVQNIETGEVHALTEDLTVALRVSPDGKSVITLEPDLTYYIQPLNGGESKELPGVKSDDEPIQWSDDGRAVYVKGSGEFSTKIYRVDLATGDRTEWKVLDPPNKIGHVGLEVNPGGILITPDGKVCLYTYWILLQHLLTRSIY